jgi:hypothetical protein
LAVPFNVVLLDGDRVVATIRCGESLSAAKEHDMSRMPIQRRRSGANQVQVRNEIGEVVFQYRLR